MELAPFAGRDVVQTAVKVTKAGDGLSAALAIDPRELNIGDKVTIVIDTEVSRVDFAPIKDTDVLVREHTLKAVGATIIDRDLVAAALDSQAERIQLAKEAAQGVQRLDLTGSGGEGDAENTEDEAAASE